MEFAIGNRVMYAGGDGHTGALAGQTGTVSEMPKIWGFKDNNTTFVTFDEYPGLQEVLTDCLALV